MSQENILVVDDEEDILELVRYNLAREGFRVLLAATGEEALRLLRAQDVDCVILDLMLPGMDGLEVARVMKREASLSGIPIIMLTAKGEEADVVAGLELGADDYVSKPFSPRVLVARVRAVLRRGKADEAAASPELEIHGIHIHPGMRNVTIAGMPVDLTCTEFSLLNLLAQKPGWVFTRGQIVDVVRGEDYPVTERSVDVHVVSLRKKLGQMGGAIETVRGVGYRFKERP